MRNPKFKDLVEMTTDWIWEISKDGIYTYVSPKVKDILGYEVDEIIGKTPFDLMPENEAEKISKFFKEKANKKEPFFGLENINRHKDGHLVVLETNGMPIFDKRGDLIGYRGIDRDITERKRMAEELKKYQLIVETVQDAIFVKDLNSHYISVNQKTLEAFGKSRREEVLGKRDNELLPPEQAKINIEDDQKVFKRGRPVEITKKMTAGGKDRYFQTVKVPLRDNQGKIIGLIGIARDITEPKKLISGLKKTVGERVRFYRKEKDLSLRAIAQRTGLSVSLISQIEKGKTAPSLSTLCKIGEALEVEISKLVKGI